ncbi:MAG: hypothetical protein GF398_15505 [Chitinivibrionales bacterium]|nr:hypothetical protein [Chitinivibrionales bacterium]
MQADTGNALFRIVKKPFVVLKNNPVLYSNGKINVVGFGAFAALETFIIICGLNFYIWIKGLPVETLTLSLLTAAGIFIWTGSKVFHWIALGKKFFEKPWKYIRETGFYHQGGIAGAIIWLIYAAFVTGLPFSALADGICWAALLGHAFGRLGCFNYGCCFGKHTQGMISIRYTNLNSKILRWRPNLYNAPIHPTQLYMSLLNLAGFFIATSFIIFETTGGLVTCFFLSWHGITRMSIEPFRGDLIHHEGRNWTTFRAAGSLILFAVFLWFTGPYFDPAFRTYLSNALSPGLHSFVNLLKHKPAVMLYALTGGLLSMTGYGIHGAKLGTFPHPFETIAQIRKEDKVDISHSVQQGEL